MQYMDSIQFHGIMTIKEISGQFSIIPILNMDSGIQIFDHFFCNQGSDPFGNTDLRTFLSNFIKM